MSHQETFDAIVYPLLKQNAKSILPGTQNSCAYRGEDGRKCAVGHIIPDEEYDPKMEEKSSSHEIFDDFFSRHEHDRELVLMLQCIHDSSRVCAWPRQFKTLANKYGLAIQPEFWTIKD